jgi:ClpP class serine protease
MITMFLRKIGFRAITAKLAAAEKKIAEMSAEQRTLVSDVALERKPDYRVENGVAHIGVRGLLMQKADPILAYFGIENTGYDEILQGIAEAEADVNVKSVDFDTDTPGGDAAGVDLVAQAIQDMKKPNRGVVHTRADSSGYYIISQTDEIVATSRASEVGSIGAVISALDDTEYLAKEGLKKVVITNEASGDKRPDIATDEGRAVYKSYLNDLYDMFEERIIEGRSGKENFNIENVRELKGRVVTARKAIELGLIDGMAVSGKIENGVTTKNEGESNMAFNYAKLCEANPELQNHVDGLVSAASAEASATAITAERARVTGCLSVAGLTVPELAQKAIDGGDSDGDLAKAMIANRKPQSSNTEEIPSVSATVALEKGDAGEEAQAKKLDAILNKVHQKAGN